MSIKIYLIGCHITPMLSSSSHADQDPVRTRKLLINRAKIDKMSVKVDSAGYTLVPLDLHFLNGRVKLQVGLAKGKKQHDKRDSEKARDWEREKAGIMRSNQKYT